MLTSSIASDPAGDVLSSNPTRLAPLPFSQQSADHGGHVYRLGLRRRSSADRHGERHKPVDAPLERRFDGLRLPASSIVTTVLLTHMPSTG
jgi:hypothetical protein